MSKVVITNNLTGDETLVDVPEAAIADLPEILQELTEAERLSDLEKTVGEVVTILEAIV